MRPARIDGALTAYACGDALGVPWENQPDATARVTPGQIEQLPACCRTLRMSVVASL